MKNSTFAHRAFVPAVAAVATIALITVAATPSQPHGNFAADCVVTVADSIVVQEQPVKVKATVNEAVGDSLKATFQDESHIAVLGVADETSDKANVLMLNLDASKAAAGTWKVTIQGSKALCVGTAKVVAPK